MEQKKIDEDAYVVKIVDIRKKKDKLPAKMFGKHRQAVSICGSRATGKTTMLTHFTKAFWRHTFDKIFYISPSAKIDPILATLEPITNLELLQVDNENIHTTITSILEFAEQVKSQGYKYEFLVILDDTQTLNKAKASIETLYLRGRHFGIAVISCWQSYKGMPAPARCNTECWLFFAQSNAEAQKIAEELSLGDMHPNTFKRILDCYTEKPYHFMLLDEKHTPRLRGKI